MKDCDCITFLRWALPRMGLRWPGFRKVRRQVCKRVSRRMKELGLEAVAQYRERLEQDRNEWLVLDAACRITISRFYRDKHVFDVLAESVLPEIAQTAIEEKRSARCWCAGCASGEEVYTLAILWEGVVRAAFADAQLDIIGTDADPVMIARAEKACYARGSLKDVPPEWLDRAFEKSGREFCVPGRYRDRVTILSQDIREAMPEGPFDLILCRNLVFTYFDAAFQKQMLDRITARLRPGGYLVIGAHEKLPKGSAGFEALETCREILRHAKGNP